MKTGCPASSLLFLLGINPIVDLFLLMCDGPKLAVTRVCADDFGSAMRALTVLKQQSRIFKIAALVAGLHLKCVKCVLVFSGTEVTEFFEQRVRQWLRDNIPEFASFRIASSGKYLGWVLGRNFCFLSFQEPLAKYNKRVVEVVGGHAPCTVALLRYNERAASVLSYVSQFGLPPEECGVLDKEQHALHKVLRLPPNSLPRSLLSNLSLFSCVEPIRIYDFCLATLYRFAISEIEYLCQLASDIRSLVGDDWPLADFDAVVPEGFLGSPPILQSLVNAVSLKKEHLILKRAVEAGHKGKWMLSPCVVHPCGSLTCPVPTDIPNVKVLSCVLECLRMHREQFNFNIEFAKKAITTLGEIVSCEIRLSPGWFDDLSAVLGLCKVFVRIAWLKTISGGWFTTTRMSEPIKWPCIFGCDAKDEIGHYLICPILWQFAAESLGAESSIFMGNRLGFNEPTVQKLKTLAFVHFIYHSCKFDSVCVQLLNTFCQNHGTSPWRIVQDRAKGFARTCHHLVR